MTPLFSRAKDQCELCGGSSALQACPVDKDNMDDIDKMVLLCDACQAGVGSTGPLKDNHWYCLQDAIWSDVPAVQVVSHRLLNRMSEQTWAADLLDQAYLEPRVLSWAQEVPSKTGADHATVDCNGTRLSDGDTVTLIRDLNVKGANFTAKRGTTVKNIRVGDDPEHIEGRINKMSIMLKTCFLKRIST